MGDIPKMAGGGLRARPMGGGHSHEGGPKARPMGQGERKGVRYILEIRALLGQGGTLPYAITFTKRKTR